MLADAETFSSFAVDDLETVRGFYEKTLGLKTSDVMGVMALHLAGDRAALVYPKPDYEPASFTVLNFRVSDIDEAVDELAARGVRFERYDAFTHDEKGVVREGGPLLAWFKDPAGNVLSVLQEV